MLFCSVLLHSKSWIDFSQWRSSPPSTSIRIHNDASSSMLHCGRDAVIVVFLTRSSKTPLRCISLTPHNSAESLWTGFLNQQFSAINLLSLILRPPRWLFKECIYLILANFLICNMWLRLLKAFGLGHYLIFFPRSVSKEYLPCIKSVKVRCSDI